MENERPQCTDCRAQSPPTHTSYTLISQQHGWRLAIDSDEAGQRTGAWRCPKCWTRRREAKLPTR